MKLPAFNDHTAFREQFGLHIDQTGGGCLALGYYPPSADGFYLWITENGCEIPADTETLCDWGIYEPTGNVNWIAQGYDTFANIYDKRDALIALARHLHSIGRSELSFEDVADALRKSIDAPQ